LEKTGLGWNFSIPFSYTAIFAINFALRVKSTEPLEIPIMENSDNFDHLFEFIVLLKIKTEKKIVEINKFQHQKDLFMLTEFWC